LHYSLSNDPIFHPFGKSVLLDHYAIVLRPAPRGCTVPRLRGDLSQHGLRIHVIEALAAHLWLQRKGGCARHQGRRILEARRGRSGAYVLWLCIACVCEALV
jgi:hypothetical protein